MHGKAQAEVVLYGDQLKLKELKLVGDGVSTSLVDTLGKEKNRNKSPSSNSAGAMEISFKAAQDFKNIENIMREPSRNESSMFNLHAHQDKSDLSKG